MGPWSSYFFGKLLLYVRGDIDFNVALNLAFALFLILPLRWRGLRIARQIVAIPAGIALLYRDSWLPPIQRALSQANNLSQFDASYLLELLGRFINPAVVLILILMLVIDAILRRRLRMSSFAIVAILLVPLTLKVATTLQHPAAAVVATAQAAETPEQPAANDQLSGILDHFFQQEAQRKIAFTPAPDDKAPFDVVFLHICSLGNDDISYVNQQGNPLLNHMDLRFDSFSAATSYSGPAAIRLLRSACGQQKHSDLYEKTAPECYLFSQLQNVGFKPEFLMNHDGHFGNFIDDVRKNGGLSVPLETVTGVPVAMHSFDGSEIYDDYAELSRWWQQRQSQPDARVALYYNTISLHDGNKLADGRSLSAVDSYSTRLAKLLDDMDRFMKLLADSGKRVVVVFIPEHGAGLRGDKLQISGLREIPSAAIALVPVGVKLIGLPQPVTQKIVRQPSSHLAISQLLSQFVAHNPYEAPALDLNDYANNLPRTEFVAEGGDVTVMHQGGRYMMRNPDLSWSEYPH